MEVGAAISLDGIVGASAFVVFPLHRKTQKMACKNTIVGSEAHRMWGNPVRTQHGAARRVSHVTVRRRAVAAFTPEFPVCTAATYGAVTHRAVPCCAVPDPA